jgi:hypothetical protein
MRCRQCEHDVPELDFCIRCGFPLGVTASSVPRRRVGRLQYAAEPRQHAWVPHLTSTLFPQLPRADMGSFLASLLLGAAVIAALAAAGLFPIALTAACVLVPVLVAVYMFAIDIYEERPLLVVGLTAATGAAGGLVLGLWLQHITASTDGPGFGTLGDSGVLLRVAVVPLLGGVLALVGPLVLLHHPRFNDVLDGATFGATAAVTLIGAQTLVQAWPITESGSRPGGAVEPWLVRLFEIGLLLPLVSAGAIGGVAAAFWLRYRAPVRDRHALGPLGSPAAALVAAAALVIAGPLSLQVFGRDGALAPLLALAAVAMIFLRRAIHLGLVEEADEIEVGPIIVCANCRRETPRHTFCGRCGIALRALPKAFVDRTA